MTSSSWAGPSAPSMSNKLLNSPEVLSTVLDILLKRGLWEALRGSAETAPESR